MAESKINMPGVFGGLMRYDEEYNSKIMLSPGQVVVFIVTILVFVLGMKIFF